MINNWKFWRSSETQRPQRLILMLHGCGGNADDVLSFAPLLAREAKGFGQTPFVAVAPDGFLPSVEKSDGYQWFDIENNYHPALFEKPAAELTAKERRMFANMAEGDDGLFKASETLNRFLDFCQEKFKIGDSATTVFGYSQGAMQALDVGLSRKTAVEKIVAVSGGLVPPFSESLNERRVSSPEVLLIHGTNDGVVSFKSAKQTEALLRGAGVSVRLVRQNGMGHGRGGEAQAFWNAAAKETAAELRSGAPAAERLKRLISEVQR